MAGGTQAAPSGLVDGVGVARGGVALPWRALLVATLLAVALGVTLSQGLAGERSSVALAPARSRAFSHESLLSLPLAARGTVSRALGADSPAYRVRAERGGLRASTPAQHLSASFSRSGVSVHSGAAYIGLRLHAVGFGSDLASLGGVTPHANANRVDFSHPGISEWYANGPAGLEQGFTIARTPAHGETGPLTVEMELSGNTQADLTSAAGESVIALSRNGRNVLRYSGLTATDAAGRPLHSWLALKDGRLLLRVDTDKARFPVRIDPFIQSAELTASDGTSGEFLGWSVATSGKTVVVGAPERNVGTNTAQGAALVFVEPASGWANATQTAELTAAGGSPGEGLGASVSISGNTIVAGAPAGNKSSHVGAAYVFVEPKTGWADETQTATLTAGNGGGYEQMGASVAVSQTTIAVGAPDLGSGAALIFTRPSAGWSDATQSAELSASDSASGSGFGDSIAMSEGTIVVGADHRELDGSRDEGAAYVFVEPETGWTDGEQTAVLTASDPTTGGPLGDELGRSVSISGATIVAGAPFHEDGSTEFEGAAYVFVKPQNGWTNATQTAELAPAGGATGEYFGSSVAVAGKTILAGAPSRSGVNSDEGAVYQFQEPHSGWSDAAQGTLITAPDAGREAQVGFSVAMSEGTIAVGAPRKIIAPEQGQQGAAYVFEAESALPKATAPPGITGTPGVGQVLTETHGAWTNEPTGFAYQWLRCTDTATSCDAIPGATNQTYTMSAEDVGSEIEVQEIANNAAGASLPAFSTALGTLAPLAASRPTITGIAQQGTTLTEDHGTWENQAETYSYQWLRCEPSGQGCTPIAGATEATYVPSSIDIESKLEVRETASNRVGQGAAEVSLPSRPVTVGLGTLTLGGSQQMPVMNWNYPTQASATGCPYGIAAVTVLGTNTLTGGITANAVGLSETSAGSGDYSGSLPAQYPVHGPVSVHSSIICMPSSTLSPSTGPATGGTNVIVPGPGLSGATGVSFGNTPAESYTVQSDDVIEAVAPPGSGTVPVTVYHGTEGAAIDAYTYQAVESISPAGGPASGGTWVTIRGTGLASATDVSFGQTSVHFVKLGDGDLDVLSPAGGGTQDIVVTTPVGGATATGPADQFTYVASGGSATPSKGTLTTKRVTGAPGAASFAPAPFKGPATPASVLGSPTAIQVLRAIHDEGPVMVTGLDRLNTLIVAESTVLDNSCENSRAAVEESVKVAIDPAVTEAVESLIPVIETGELALTPELGPGVLLLRAVTPLVVGWVAGELVDQLVKYDVDAVMASCPPEPDPEGEDDEEGADARIDPSGTVLTTNGNPVGGASVTLLRANTAAGPFTAVDPTGPGIEPAINPEVTSGEGIFHWEVDPGYYEVTATALGCTDPGHPGQSAGRIGPYPVPPPQVGLTVTLECIDQAPAPTPVIESLGVGTGPPGGATASTVLGRGFTPSSSVTFGANQAESVTYVSPRELMVVSPPGSGSVDVQVKTAGGTSAPLAGDRFFYGSTPTVTGLSVHTGAAAGGTNVVVTGTGFTGATVAAFGGLPAASLIVRSDTEAETTTPAGFAGTVDVQVVTPAGTSAETSADRYTYVAAPANTSPEISGTPTAGLVGGLTSIAVGGADSGEIARGPSAQPASVCGQPSVDLLDAYVTGGRLRIIGFANPLLSGQTVLITVPGSKATIASGRVDPDGYFTTSSPAPPRKAQLSKQTRYEASIGTKHSAALVLSRRLHIFEVSAGGGGLVRITGEIAKPLTKPPATISVSLRDSCQTPYVHVRARAKLNRSSGTFTILAPAPPSGDIGAVYRLQTRVQAGARNRKTIVTLSLPRPVGGAT